uniref:G_PROTEIN_RECEP_F1_2 domain-containing protein n=1 Tax=Macrostomum lignano TaxID=282301 RepID=A0A1I8GYX1_9PLAT
LLWDLASFGGLGVDPAELLRMARGSAHRDRARRRDEVTTVADVMRRTLNGGCSYCFCCGRCRCMQCEQKRADWRWSITLLPSYLLVKLIGMANVVLQLIILRQFFGLDLTAWSHWEETAFPSVGICKLQYQALTHLQSIVAFCTISTNVLTEKVALLLSIYLPIVLAICTLSLLLWIYRLTKHRTLRSLDSNFLGTNGLFLLHMILINAGELFTSELIGDLYRGFVQRQGPKVHDRNVPSDTCPETSAISLAVTETSRSAMV